MCQQYDTNCSAVIDLATKTASCGAASACIADLQLALSSADCSLFGTAGSPAGPDCAAAFGGSLHFAGTVAEGSSCAASTDCQQRADGGVVGCGYTGECGQAGICTAGVLGQICDDGSCSEGFCSEVGTGTCVPFVPVGGDCSLGGCDPSANYCASATVNSVTTYTCQPYLVLGASCDGTFANGCSPSDWCGSADAGFFGGAGTCLPRGGEGAACWENCGASNCQPGLSCEGTCQKMEDFTCGGACDSTHCLWNGTAYACVSFGQFGSFCDSNNPCDADLICGPSATCVGYPGEGEPCSAGASACRAGDYCDTHAVCRTLGQLGDACTNQYGQPTCLGGTCDGTSHCAAFRPAGSSCRPYHFDCSATPGDECAIDSTNGPGDIWYCLDPACQETTDGGTGSFCAPGC